MKKRKRLTRGKKIALYVGGFILSCLLVPVVAKYADNVRGYDGTGGEVLLPLLYLIAITFINTISDYKKENAHD